MSIQVIDISKGFHDRRTPKAMKDVLQNISFDVEDGQFVSLLGPSGCGKTTTLTIIAGFQSHDTGKILVNGKEVTKPGPDRAFVFQNYALLPWLKVGENIMYPMRKRKISKTEQKKRLHELLEMAQLSEYENYYIHELSGGMRQRVSLLRALACDPDVLLMDEPLGAVDFQMRQLLQMQLEAMLQQKKTTCLMVTHDVDEAVYLSDRVVVMSREHGKILADVKVDLARPRDRTDERYHGYIDQLTDILRTALNGDVMTSEDEDLMKFIHHADQEKAQRKGEKLQCKPVGV